MMYHRLVKTLLNSLQIKYLEIYRERTRVLSSAGRASPLQGECRRFDPVSTQTALNHLKPRIANAHGVLLQIK